MLDSVVKSGIIEQVEQYQTSTGNIYINFVIDGYDFELSVNKNHSGYYEPSTLWHLEETEKICPFCRLCTGDGNCSALTVAQDARNQLFHRLIQHNSIRLNWLFTPHNSRESKEKQ